MLYMLSCSSKLLAQRLENRAILHSRAFSLGRHLTFLCEARCVVDAVLKGTASPNGHTGSEELRAKVGAYGDTVFYFRYSDFCNDSGALNGRSKFSEHPYDIKWKGLSGGIKEIVRSRGQETQFHTLM